MIDFDSSRAIAEIEEQRCLIEGQQVEIDANSTGSKCSGGASPSWKPRWRPSNSCCNALLSDSPPRSVTPEQLNQKTTLPLI